MKKYLLIVHITKKTFFRNTINWPFDRVFTFKAKNQSQAFIIAEAKIKEYEYVDTYKIYELPNNAFKKNKITLIEDEFSPVVIDKER